MMKPARLRPRAKIDLSDQAWYYAREVNVDTADAFVDEALAALSAVEQQPGMGSPRWSTWSTQPPLRAWRIGRFPMVWFYVERGDHLDVLRLLGERQDIATILRDETT